MSVVSVITDSSSSIPDEMYDRYELIVVPYYVHVEGQPYRDLVDMTREAFLRHLLATTKAEQFPKSANPGAGDYLDAFRRAFERGPQMVALNMTSSGSGAYQAALLAKGMFLEEQPEARVEVIDTRNVSMCHGWMSIEAARAAQAGRSLEEIVARVDSMIPVTRMIQTADTLKYLYLGGRIGRAQHLMGSILRIKPLISMDDGIIVSLGTARSRRFAYRRMMEIMDQDVPSGGTVKAAVIHFGAPEDASALREMIQDRFDCMELIVTELSPALAVHTGPGTVGVCYFPPGLTRIPSGEAA